MLLLRTFFTALSALPLAAVAQAPTPVAATVPRFFVGGGVAFGGYPLPDRFGVNVFSFVPTVGVQLTPRLAVQVSGAYKLDHTYPTFMYDPAYPYWATTERSNRDRTLVIPVLARYALTRKLAHRFQADVLGGVSIIHFTVLSEVFPLDSNQQPLPSAKESASTTSACATLGAGVRFALCPRLEITAEAELNHLIGGKTVGSQISANVAAGLRYHFGREL